MSLKGEEVAALSKPELDLSIGAVRRSFQAMACQEFARQRKRLGQLTLEQERAVEALLLSTVEEIAHPVIEQMLRSGEISQAD